jgi:hypothetical protein
MVEVTAFHTAIDSFIENHNADPKPFRWTKSADNILASIERFCVKNMPERTSGSGYYSGMRFGWIDKGFPRRQLF